MNSIDFIAPAVIEAAVARAVAAPERRVARLLCEIPAAVALAFADGHDAHLRRVARSTQGPSP
jgi:hypothetical protein